MRLTNPRPYDGIQHCHRDRWASGATLLSSAARVVRAASLRLKHTIMQAAEVADEQLLQVQDRAS